MSPLSYALVRAGRAGRRATAFLRPLPNFLIIGAQRSGTTSLYNVLCRHQAVAGPKTKEVHFFDLAYNRGAYWYRSWFPLSPSPARIGEATPYYLLHPQVPARVRETIPSVKLIVLLRSPADRAWSHYLHETELGVETLEFEEALEAEAGRLATGNSFNQQHFSYMARGRYAEQLARWFELFPREQLCVIPSEDFFADTRQVLARVARFLEIRDDFSAELSRDNSSGGAAMPEGIRARLVEEFRPDRTNLEKLLGIRFAWD